MNCKNDTQLKKHNNTKMNAIEKTRLWVATIYDMDFDFQACWGGWDTGRPDLQGRRFTYLGWGREVCATTGRDHFQVCARFRNPRGSLKQVSGIFGKAHVEKMVGTLDRSIAYCGKEGDYKSLGEEPEQGQRTDLGEIMLDIKNSDVPEQDLAEQFPARWCQYGRRFERYRRLIQAARSWKTEVRVWWGPPGTGKTHAATAWLGDEYDDVSYTSGGFFIGYHNKPNILLDDFDGIYMERKVFMRMTDEYKYTANIKNGEANWNPVRIAITSNTHPRDWYTGIQTNDEYAVLRRINEIVNLTERWNGTENGTEVPEQ